MIFDVETATKVFSWSFAALARVPIERLVDGTLYDLDDEEASRRMTWLSQVSDSNL